MTRLSAAAAAIIEVYRSTTERAERLPADEQEIVFSTLFRDLASRRPECVASLASGWEPTEEARDPRGAA